MTLCYERVNLNVTAERRVNGRVTCCDIPLRHPGRHRLRHHSVRATATIAATVTR